MKCRTCDEEIIHNPSARVAGYFHPSVTRFLHREEWVENLADHEAKPAETMLAKHVSEGDLLDLEGDPIADPRHDGTCHCEPDCGHFYGFEFELVDVLTVDRESKDTVVIGSHMGVWAFPADHEIVYEGSSS